jgi:hypothetical protein
MSESSEQWRRYHQQTARYALAIADMQQASAAASLLRNTTELHASRALETAMVVCYCRPFGDNHGIGSIDAKKFAPQNGVYRAIHTTMLDLRDKAHAHSDTTSGARGIFPDPDAVPIEGWADSWAEQWISFDRELLQAVVQLCEVQGTAFSQAAKKAHDWYWKNAPRTV